MHESILYKKLPDNKVQCQTCHHFCNILPGKRGICGVRENQDGKLYALNYGKAIAAHIDPIEKKPLYHFMPGTKTYSVATAGCNFRCLHCQNAEISQSPILLRSSLLQPYHPFNSKKAVRSSRLRQGYGGQAPSIKEAQMPGENMTPQEIVDSAIKNNCPSISYTYTEPTIFLEYALDIMKLAKGIRENSEIIRTNSQLKNVWVSNGYMSDKTLELILPYLDAINIDLKSFSEKFYTKICGAKLQPVLDNLVKIKKANIHLEVTTLVIPGHNDSEKELTQIAEFICNKLGKDTPWHVSAFYPTYKMQDASPTPVEKIYQAVEIGKQVGLKFVHAGNV